MVGREDLFVGDGWVQAGFSNHNDFRLGAINDVLNSVVFHLDRLVVDI